MSVKHGLYLAPFGELAEPRRLVDIAQAAEQGGWDGVFLWDHMLRPIEETQLIGDAWISMAAMAMATATIRLGPLVTPITRRRPWKLARESVALDRLSDGRLILGLGLGVDSGGELTRLGEIVDPLVRADRLDEGARLLLALWSGEPVTHLGEHFLVDDAQFRPVALQRPHIPLWFAARKQAQRPVRRAARIGNGIHAIEMDEETVATMLETIVAERGSLDGFDIALNVEPGTDGSARGAQGATWIMHAFGPTATFADVMAVVRNGRH